MLAPPVLPWVKRARASRFSVHSAQPARLGLGIKHNPGLFQYPRFDAFMVQAQQVERAHRVMLFCRGAGLVALNLRHNASGDFQPLGQALETPAQAVAWAWWGLAMGCAALPDTRTAPANTHSPRRGRAASRCHT